MYFVPYFIFWLVTAWYTNKSFGCFLLWRIFSLYCYFILFYFSVFFYLRRKFCQPFRSPYYSKVIYIIITHYLFFVKKVIIFMIRAVLLAVIHLNSVAQKCNSFVVELHCSKLSWNWWLIYICLGILPPFNKLFWGNIWRMHIFLI